MESSNEYEELLCWLFFLSCRPFSVLKYKCLQNYCSNVDLVTGKFFVVDITLLFQFALGRVTLCPFRKKEIEVRKNKACVAENVASDK